MGLGLGNWFWKRFWKVVKGRVLAVTPLRAFPLFLPYLSNNLFPLFSALSPQNPLFPLFRNIQIQNISQMIAAPEGGNSSRPRDSQVSNRRPQQNNLRQLMQAYQGYRQRSQPSQSNQPQIRINLQQLLPLLKSLDQQNSLLKKQKASIAEQFKRLDFVTDTLTKENSEMQMHCLKRAVDLEKLVQTISLNFHEEENDLDHRIHLLREENHVVIRSLNEMLGEQGELEERIQRDEKQKLNLANSQRQDEMRALEYQSKVQSLQQQIQTLQRHRKTLLEQYSQSTEQVNTHCLSNMKLRTTNITRIYQLKSFQLQITHKKPTLQKDNLRLHTDLLLLRKEVAQREKELEGFEARVGTLEGQLDRVREAVREKQEEVEGWVGVLAGAREEGQRWEGLFGESRQREGRFGGELQEQVRKLEELNKQLKSAQLQSTQQHLSFLEQLKQKKHSYSSAIRNLQSTLSKRSAAYSEQKTSLEFTIRELKLSIEASKQDISEQNADLSELQRQLTSYNQSNKELEKVNYQLRQVDQELEASRRRMSGVH